jgi:ATP-dependent Lhr-like helicase
MKFNILDIHSQFHPGIQHWFNETFDHPTPPQIQGWQSIFKKENTLILAPTGSGKTLAAFLVCIDNLLKKLIENNHPKGVHTLYISPLKALNYDIERNLEAPLAGIKQKAIELNLDLPDIRVAVRTGDTPQKERERMLREPPHIFITTPESLHLLLTSQRAQHILRSVEYVIVDEIHALSENKRGTFLSLLLERLQHIAEKQFVRIGLSATQKPLEEIAKFLGGSNLVQQNGNLTFTRRPVTIVDAGMRKELDLKIISPVEDFRDLPENTVWPDIYQKLLKLIQQHRSTLIFANNRAAAERITAEVNERAGFELVKAHHGSVSKEARREIEEQLKQGKLTALVATATLELGIDMGAIDLVCQVESPKGVARGLQRVGRAGHLYQLASKGRLIPKMRSDLVEMTVITKAMYRGDVAPIKIPKNCLDILAQQIIAMVAMKPWQVDELFNLVRQAYPYQALPRSHFVSVIEMISGRYPSEAFRDLRPRISWDRVNNIVHPLPGTQRTAILGGGAIPDTGQYGCYLEDGFTKLGELEEEFVYERRLGEVFVLGTNNWRIKEITHDRVIVSPAPETPARMPFWKGEFVSRSFHLGKLYGQFCRELSQRLQRKNCIIWLQQNNSLDTDSAKNLYHYFKDQKQTAGSIPDDETILIESFYDELGDPRIVILSPYGGRVHLSWKLAILAQFRQSLNVEPESLHSDGGIVFRYPVENINCTIEIIKSVTAKNVERLVIEELANSAFFGIRFRHNANRAMLIPRPKPGKRSPLWLQRMRSRDLLEIARQYPSFPIVVETYRESLQDYLAVEELKELLSRIETGKVKIIIRQASQPSPFTATLMLEFMAGYMYNYDEPKSTNRSADAIDKDFIQDLIHPEHVAELLHTNAINQIEQKLQGQAEGYQARTPSELVELLYRIGDLTEEEISIRVSRDHKLMLEMLGVEHRTLRVFIPGVDQPWRWIAAEDFPLYRDAFSIQNADENLPESYQKIFIKTGDKIQSQLASETLPQEIITQTFVKDEAQRKILERYLTHHALLDVEQIISRYLFETSFVQQILNDLKQNGQFLEIASSKESKPIQWASKKIVERIRRVTLRQERVKIQPCDTAQFVEFLSWWQNRTPETKLSGVDGLVSIIEKFQGLALAADIWETEIFTRRIKDYQPGWLDDLCRQGEITWYGSSTATSLTGNIAFAFREDLPYFHYRNPNFEDQIDDQKEKILDQIRNALHQKGACFVNDLSLETGLAPSTCAAALWELIWLGEVTNDTFAVIRAGKPPFSLDQFTEKMPRRNPYRRIGRTHRYRPVPGSGRWSLLTQPSDTENIQLQFIETIANQLLQRYGMICREIYELENCHIPWRSIYETLVRLEWRGEIRRGYFVKGFSGLQFAVPKAADEIMNLHQNKPGYNGESNPLILINTSDPANLYGAASPLPLLHPMNPDWRLLRHPNNYLILKNGLPLLAIESKGARLTPLRDLSLEEIKEALNLLPQLLDDPAGWRRIRSIKVEFWDGEPVRNSESSDYLKKIGFRDEFKMMVLEREY